MHLSCSVGALLCMLQVSCCQGPQSLSTQRALQPEPQLRALHQHRDMALAKLPGPTAGHQRPVHAAGMGIPSTAALCKG